MPNQSHTQVAKEHHALERQRSFVGIIEDVNQHGQTLGGEQLGRVEICDARPFGCYADQNLKI